MSTVSASWLRDIPPIPRLCREVMAMAEDGEVPLPKVAAVVEADPRMTLQLLRVANSPAMGRRYPATTVREAVVAVGAEETARIAIGCALLLDVGVPRGELSLDTVLQHGLGVSRAWKPFGDSEATSGVLASGPLLALTRDAAAFHEYLAEAPETNDYEELHALERSIWGMTRCEVADELSSIWRLPARIAEVLGGWHVCHRTLPALYETFQEVASASDHPLIRTLATR